MFGGSSTALHGGVGNVVSTVVEGNETVGKIKHFSAVWLSLEHDKIMSSSFCCHILFLYPQKANFRPETRNSQ